MIWKISDVLEGVDYKACLCQSVDGKREIKLADVDSNCPEDSFLRTSVIPRSLLLKRDLLAISENVALDSGERFYVDAHGVWFAESELAQRRSGVPFSEVVWVTAAAPKLPPA